MACHWLRDIPAEIRLEVYKAYFSTVTITPHSGCSDCCDEPSHNPILALLLANKTVYIEAQPLVWKFATIDLTACTSSGRWLLADKAWKRATKVLQSGLELRDDSLSTLLELEYGLAPLPNLSTFAIQRLECSLVQVFLNNDCLGKMYRLLEKGVQEVITGFLGVELAGKAVVGAGLLQIKRHHGIHMFAGNEENLGKIKTFVEESNVIKNKGAVSYALKDGRAIRDWIVGSNQASA